MKRGKYIFLNNILTTLKKFNLEQSPLDFLFQERFSYISILHIRHYILSSPQVSINFKQVTLIWTKEGFVLLCC
jgi:hypothetical protein